jgi:hypothetical protein
MIVMMVVVVMRPGGSSWAADFSSVSHLDLACSDR